MDARLAPHTGVVSLAVVVVTVAQLLDLGTFVRMIEVHGAAAEANPLVAHLLVGQGLPFVAAAKVSMLAVVVAILVVLAGRGDQLRSPRLVALIAFAAIGAGLVGGWTNAASILAGSI
jgi:hypothetical protein